jgi:succinylarginine dihydrolase
MTKAKAPTPPLATPDEALESALTAWIDLYYRDITKVRALAAAVSLRDAIARG